MDLDGDVSHMQPPIIRPGIDYQAELDRYDSMIKACEALQAQVKCDKRSREDRAEAMFYVLARGGDLKIPAADVSAAEVLCSRRSQH